MIVEYDENTANTPYTAGLTGVYKAGMALLCMTGFNYGHIIAFTAGTNQIFNRYKVVNGWSDWEEVNGPTSPIKVFYDTDFLTIANSVPTNKKLTCRVNGSGERPVTGLPSNSLYLVEICAISDVTAIANAYSFPGGNRYCNVKNSGIWSGWVNKNDPT